MDAPGVIKADVARAMGFPRRVMALLGRIALHLFAAPIAAEYERRGRLLHAIFDEPWRG